MRRTKRDIVIAVCQVASAHAIPDRDERLRSAGWKSDGGVGCLSKAEHRMGLGEATEVGFLSGPERPLRNSA